MNELLLELEPLSPLVLELPAAELAPVPLAPELASATS